jgi:two-component system chemotaxis sensor kinase CheA
LIDIVGEMVIAHSMVAQDPLVAKGNHHELVKNVSRASKIMRELQDISQSMRMVTLKATFNKMARLVRDVANKSGKKVSFITEGEDTEIDRNLVDIINDPLIHMVRNAVDHGIETPAIRVRTGKPDYGTVKFAAYHSAGNVVVKIEDDGKGLDRELILTRAREQGLVEDGISLSDREVFNLIFEPGFSTAHTVTDISGRGVGMDVVKKNIETLGGQVEIISQPGKGSIFKMRFPLTLAIIDGMIVQVGSQNFIIPTVSIVRSIKPESGDIFTVHHRGEMLSLQEKLIPVFRLASLYNIEGALENQKQSLVMVVEDEDGQSGLLIDEMVGRQQVVIKTLGETMKDIPGISGGAIMPDGRIGLILDVAGLLKFAKTAQGEGLADKSLRKNSRILAA